IQRGDKTTASPNLISRFRNSQLDWPNQEVKIKMGLILSGGTLVDDYEYRQGLLELQPEAIGGEMEGAGLRDAAIRYGANWILVKGVCDYGHNKQTPDKDADQHLAATNAIKFVVHTIEQGGFGNTVTPQTMEVYEATQAVIPNRFPLELEPKRSLIGRDEEFGWSVKVLSNDWSGIVIQGLGGVGKTLLAEHLSKHCFDNQLFQVVVSVSLKQKRFSAQGVTSHRHSDGNSLKDVLNTICQRSQNNHLLRKGLALKTAGLIKHFYETSTATNQTLFVIDNLETLTTDEQDQLFDFFGQLPSFCKVLLTSRLEPNCDLQIYTLRLKGLSLPDTKQLLVELASPSERLSTCIAEATTEQLGRFHTEIEGLPLCIGWSLTVIKKQLFGFQQFLDYLDERPSTCSLEQYLFDGAITTQYEQLIMKTLVHFPSRIAKSTLKEIVDYEQNGEFEEGLSRLVANWLTETDFGQNFWLHPLARQFAKNIKLSNPEYVGRVPAGLVLIWSDFISKHGLGEHSDNKTHAIRYSDDKKDLQKIDSEWNNIAAAIELIHKSVYPDNQPIEPYFGYRLIEIIADVSEYLLFYGRWKERVELNKIAFQVAKDLSSLPKDQFFDGQNYEEHAAWRAYAIAWTYKKGYEDEPEILEQWLQVFEECAQESGDDHIVIEAIRMRGIIAQESGNYEDANRLLCEAMRKYEQIDALKSVSNVLNDIGTLQLKQGNLQLARKALKRAYDLQVSCQGGTQECTSAICGNLGDVELADNNFNDARLWYEEQEQLGKVSGRLSSIASALCGLAKICERQDQLKRANEFAMESLKIRRQICAKSGESIPEEIVELVARTK
ncbi:MAG: tetratricopeptide repeat protein, partial [Candidatus Promineifilaceae bacterium]